MRILERERKRAQMSRAALGRAAEMHPATVGQIESGYIGKPYDSQLEKLARALNWPADRAHELLEEVSDDDRD